MATTTEHPGIHPVAAALAVINEALDSTSETPLWSLGQAECRDTLVSLTTTTTRLLELQTRVAHHAVTVEAGESTGATSTAVWWAHATHQLKPATHRIVRLAKSLDTHSLTREAMARGEVLEDQARVIIDAVEQLPDDVEVRDLCEKHLIGEAASFDAAQLRRLGRHVLAVVDPDAAEAHEARLLADEEAAAARASSFSLRRDGSGTVRGSFTLPELHATILEKALRGLAAPKHVRAHQGAGTYDHERPTKHRMGQAFEEYIERYPVDEVADAGGVSATVVVTMGLETLLGGLGPATLDNDEKITAATARRLACEAGLVPMVLNSHSVVLDQGRRTRFHTSAQRLALAVTQRHCQSGGCDTPVAMCHVHHPTPWTRGGTTSLANAQLLCPRHHRLIHTDTPVPHPRT